MNFSWALIEMIPRYVTTPSQLSIIPYSDDIAYKELSNCIVGKQTDSMKGEISIP